MSARAAQEDSHIPLLGDLFQDLFQQIHRSPLSLVLLLFLADFTLTSTSLPELMLLIENSSEQSQLAQMLRKYDVCRPVALGSSCK